MEFKLDEAIIQAAGMGHHLRDDHGNQESPQEKAALVETHFQTQKMTE